MRSSKWPLVVGLGVLAAASPARAQAPDATVAQEFEKLHFRSIGPATMSGRIADVAVYERNPAVYYVATAHGGVWKTTSNAAMWEPLFQNEGLISTGDVTISQSNPDLVWVGAGESNNRQSTSWGGGVYKSTDGGKTFQHMGLANSKHIHRIVIDPNNNDIVMVAATGPLFGSGGDRGVFRTTDGGRTWTNVLKGDADTGATDIVQSASDPRVVFASMYQRRRNACCMNGGGPGSGIWKSTDGGVTWAKLSGNGLPDGSLGRIGLDVYRKDANIVYASIEAASVSRAAAANASEEEPGQGMQQRPQQQSETGLYRSNDGGRTWTKVSSNNPRPMYFSKVLIDPTNPDIVYMGGVGLQMTIDGGKTFATDAALVTHDDVHAIWVNPSNPDHIVIGNDGGLAVSYDQSKTWTFIPNLPVGLFYHVSYDMETPFNVCGGMQDNYNWCGPSQSRMGRGIMNYDWFQILGGDGFVALPDHRDSRIVYTESQNGNMIRRDKVTGESKSIRPSALNVTNYTAGDTYRWFWDTPMMRSAHDAGVLLVAANKVFRSTDRGDSWTAISPDLTSNANRDTIVTMGVKNSEIRISRNDGISSWPTIVSLAESPKQQGLIYTGTDDGTVSVTRDNGRTWENITAKLPGFPKGAYISEVVPSQFDAGTVYITADNHLENDYEPYIWVSSDMGRSFRSLVTPTLRGQNVRTLTEDTKNRDVLYIGTETGIFLSLDRGASWRRLKANMPTVRVDEITIHPRDNAMIVATHGRALWILDDLSPIQEYATAQRANRIATLFTPAPALQWKSKDDRNDEFWGHQYFVGENPPADAVVNFLLKSQANEVKLRISDATGRQIREVTAPEARRAAGIQALCWDQRVEPIPAIQQGNQGGRGGQGGPGGQGGQQRAEIPGVPTPVPPAGYLPANPCANPQGQGGPGGGGGGGGFGGGANAGPHVVPGTYTVALVVNGNVVDSKPLTIRMDPEVRIAGADRERYNTIALELHEAHGRGNTMLGTLTSLSRQLGEARAKVDSSTALPASIKAQFTAVLAEYDSLRTRFGAPEARAGNRPQQQGGFGGGRFGAQDPNNALARLTSAKSSVLAFWEVPSPAVVDQANSARAALDQAIADAQRFVQRAQALSEALKPHAITISID